eukprot:2884562-Rhodomonas_salina.2
MSGSDVRYAAASWEALVPNLCRKQSVLIGDFGDNLCADDIGNVTVRRLGRCPIPAEKAATTLLGTPGGITVLVPRVHAGCIMTS